MTSPSTIQSKFLSKETELGVVAVGFAGGQCQPGVDAAPSALISAGLLDQLKDDLGYELFHDGTVHSYSSIIPSSDPDYRNMKLPLTVSAVNRRLSEQVYEHARQARCVLTLGGDHSIAIGTISGTAKAIKERLGQEIAVIWVDAHADINTPETTESGNIHGMPVAFLAGLASEKREDVFGWLQEDHKISLKKLVYIGLRDVDRGEKKILRDNGIKAFSMHDIDKHGIGRVMEMALGHIGANTPIHLSFDVDALDPQWAPSTGTPVRGGLTLREGDFIAECVHETGSLVAMDLVEVNPSLQTMGAGETIRAGCSLVRSYKTMGLLVRRSLPATVQLLEDPEAVTSPRHHKDVLVSYDFKPILKSGCHFSISALEREIRYLQPSHLAQCHSHFLAFNAPVQGDRKPSNSILIILLKAIHPQAPIPLFSNARQNAGYMDKLKDLAGKAGGGSGEQKPVQGGGGQEDYLDKGLDSAEKKFGAGGASRETNEKITDKGREMFEKQTGKDIPDKFSN
ncbi:MAG: hypothetical protein Q9218_003323 [Villophora microphyllina]